MEKSKAPVPGSPSQRFDDRSALVVADRRESEGKETLDLVRAAGGDGLLELIRQVHH